MSSQQLAGTLSRSEMIYGARMGWLPEEARGCLRSLMGMGWAVFLSSVSFYMGWCSEGVSSPRAPSRTLNSSSLPSEWVQKNHKHLGFANNRIPVLLRSTAVLLSVFITNTPLQACLPVYVREAHLQGTSIFGWRSRVSRVHGPRWGTQQACNLVKGWEHFYWVTLFCEREAD